MFEMNKIVIFSAILALLIDRDVVTFVFERRDAVIVKSFIVLNVYVFFDTIVTGVSRIWHIIPSFSFDFQDHIAQKGEKVDREQLITEKILKRKWFPYVLAKEELNMTTKEHKKIGDLLEKNWIFVRGDSNARILIEWNEELLEKTIKKLLIGDNTPLLKKIGSSYIVENLWKACSKA